MTSRNLSAILIALTLLCVGLFVAALIAWIVFYFGIYLGLGNYRVRGHQQFAVNGLDQIEVASQMDNLYDDCHHHITYSGMEGTPTWTSVAYFGGRYKLVMQLPVAIESADKGNVIGDPSFYLHEVDEVFVSPSGQVGAWFSDQLEFGPAEWNAVYDASGDFSAIGYKIKRGAPVRGFKAYTDASR